ncbi:MAG: PQQ-dependent sugar dehydrogenase, partial [Dehalococcoidia bacterium]
CPTNFADDGDGRFFVTEQWGRIFVWPKGSQPGEVGEPVLFLNITDKVRWVGGEEGLLGFALHPNFQENGHVFVYYTADDPQRSVVSRFTVSATDPNAADPTSEEVIIEIPQPYDAHNAGQLGFGPDGLLYVGLGDGGNYELADPDGYAQDLNTLLGSILRIDVDNPEDGRAYGIPPDNPFLADPDARDEIWAYGFRNPWRFSFDSNGQLWAADVGHGTWESVYTVERGKNYGWNILEGPECLGWPDYTDCDKTGLETPQHAYKTQRFDGGNGCALIGGYVYRGTEIPDLQGTYLFGDFCSGRIWGLRYDGESVTHHEELMRSSDPIISFGEDAEGEIYVLTQNGGVYVLKEQS